MKNHTKTVIACLIVLAFAGIYFAGASILPGVFNPGSVGDRQASDSPSQTLIGKRVPTFDLPKMSGGRLTSGELSGAPAVILFWATWSAASADELRILDDYLSNESMQARLVRIIAVDSQEDPTVASSYVKRGGYQSTVLIDSFGDSTAAYRVKSLPTFYFVGRDGLIQDVYTGSLSEQALVKKVEALLSGPGV